MSIQLKYLADLYTGFTIRESLEHIDVGDVKTIQIKDLPKDSRIIDTENLTGIDWRYDSKPQFLSKNSVLLVARGVPSAFIFKGTESDRVVVSNPFIVINLNSDKVSPDYLAWYITNSQMARTHFESNSTGISLPITTIKTVKELPVILPSLAEQKYILALEEKALLEAQAFERLTALRQEYNLTEAERILTETN